MPPEPKSSPESAPQTPQEGGKTAAGGTDPRQERLAQALRDNLRKRKAQQRGRRDDGS